MSGCIHTHAEHESFKEPGRWELLEMIGVQPSAFPDLPDLELRNTVEGCTLARPCHLTEAERETARAANRRTNELKRAAIIAALTAEGARP